MDYGEAVIEKTGRISRTWGDSFAWPWGSLTAAKIYAAEALRIRSASQLNDEQNPLTAF